MVNSRCSGDIVLKNKTAIDLLIKYQSESKKATCSSLKLMYVWRSGAARIEATEKLIRCH